MEDKQICWLHCGKYNYRFEYFEKTSASSESSTNDFPRYNVQLCPKNQEKNNNEAKTEVCEVKKVKLFSLHDWSMAGKSQNTIVVAKTKVVNRAGLFGLGSGLTFRKTSGLFWARYNAYK